MRCRKCLCYRNWWRIFFGNVIIKFTIWYFLSQVTPFIYHFFLFVTILVVPYLLIKYTDAYIILRLLVYWHLQILYQCSCIPCYKHDERRISIYTYPAAAMRSAVLLSSERVSRFAPFSNNSLTIDKCPPWLANIKGVSSLNLQLTFKFFNVFKWSNFDFIIIMLYFFYL